MYYVIDVFFFSGHKYNFTTFQCFFYGMKTCLENYYPCVTCPQFELTHFANFFCFTLYTQNRSRYNLENR